MGGLITGELLAQVLVLAPATARRRARFLVVPVLWLLGGLGCVIESQAVFR